MIEVTKISSKGQVTIPIEFRKLLNLTEGSKVAFVSGDDGRIYVVNSSYLALKTAQDAFRGDADALGLKNEDDVLELIRSTRED